MKYSMTPATYISMQTHYEEILKKTSNSFPIYKQTIESSH